MGVLLCPKPWFLIISKGFPIFQENWDRPQPIILALAYCSVVVSVGSLGNPCKIDTAK